MRILVSDLQHVPDDPDWELPWQLDGNWTVENGELRSDGDNDFRDNEHSGISSLEMVRREPYR